MWGLKPHTELKVFDGGLNTKLAESAVPLEYSPDCKNVVFDDVGAVGTVDGFTKLNTTAIATFPVDGLAAYTPSGGTEQLLAWCNGSMSRLSGTAFVPVTGATSVFTSGVRVRDVQTRGYAVFCGADLHPYKWNGSAFTQFGVVPPSSGVISNATASSTDSGVLLGTYNWAIAGVNSMGIIGDYRVVKSGLTLTSGRATVGGISTAPASSGIDFWNLYRTTAALSTSYYFVNSFANGTTSIVDNTLDTLLGTEGYGAAPSDNGVAPSGKYICEYRERAFIAGVAAQPMRLYYSALGAPETWPVVNFVDVGTGDGYPIVGIKPYGNSIIVHKCDSNGNGSIWILYMPDSTGASDDTNWYLVKSPASVSAEDQNSIAFFSNMMIFLNRNGVYTFEGKDIAPSSAESNIGQFLTDSHSFDIEPDIYAIQKSAITKAVSVVFQNKVWMAVPYSNSVNNRIYIYDFVRASNQNRTVGAWSYMGANGSNPLTIANCFATYGGNLYAGSSASDGFVYKMNDGHSADTAAIDSYYLTAPIYGEPAHKDFTKVFRYAMITVEASGDWDLLVSYIRDFKDETGTTVRVPLGENVSVWGTMVWGTDKWDGGANRFTVRVGFTNCVAKALQIKFATNTVAQYFKVHNMKVFYNVKGQRNT